MSGICDFSYKNKTYTQLSEEFRQLFPTALHAIQLVPKMYDRLTLVDKMSHKAALQKIFEDHKDLRGFSRRNLYRGLPLDNLLVPRRVVTSRHKSISTDTNTEQKLSVPKFPNITEDYSNNRFELVIIDAAQDNSESSAEDMKSKESPNSESINRGDLKEFEIPVGKFGALIAVLQKSQRVCFVFFDANGVFLKADADVDRMAEKPSDNP